MKIKLLQIRETIGKTIDSPKVIVEMMKREARVDRECFWVLHLNTKNKIIEKELVSVGILNSSLAAPREIFKRAILNSAYSIIAVHNHPSGDPDPSSEDKQTLGQLKQSGMVLGIHLVDFIIISPEGKYWSAREEGQIDCPARL